jgi:putative hydrolase of the HAD superfamily
MVDIASRALVFRSAAPGGNHIELPGSGNAWNAVKILFDVDGVLIDGWHADEALRKPWDTTIEQDLGIDREAFQLSFFGTVAGRSSSPMQACIIGQSDLKSALAAVLPKVGYKGGVDDFMRYWFERDSNVNMEVLELVRRIREHDDIQLFVATGQEHDGAGYLWNELGLSEYFDRMFYSAQIGFSKKDPRFFDAVNGALKIDPAEQPLFFDDQPEITALARDAGWNATTFHSARDVREHPSLRHLWSS